MDRCPPVVARRERTPQHQMDAGGPSEPVREPACGGPPSRTRPRAAPSWFPPREERGSSPDREGTRARRYERPRTSGGRSDTKHERGIREPGSSPSSARSPVLIPGSDSLPANIRALCPVCVLGSIHVQRRLGGGIRPVPLPAWAPFGDRLVYHEDDAPARESARGYPVLAGDRLEPKWIPDRHRGPATHIMLALPHLLGVARRRHHYPGYWFALPNRLHVLTSPGSPRTFGSGSASGRPIGLGLCVSTCSRIGALPESADGVILLLYYYGSTHGYSCQATTPLPSVSR
jgi:hypothetical protein